MSEIKESSENHNPKHPLTSRLEALKESLYTEVFVPVTDLMAQVTEAADRIKTQELSPADATDIGFLCRESAALLKELRKEVEARYERVANRLGQHQTDGLLNGTITEDTWKTRGRFATGAPKCKALPTLPRKYLDKALPTLPRKYLDKEKTEINPDYLALCEFMGIPADLAKRGVVDFNWEALVKICSERMERGEKLPPGIVKVATVNTMVFRRRRDKNAG
jgi:hypothetical protein